MADRALAALADLPPARVAVVVTHGGTAGRLMEALLGTRRRPPPGVRAAGQLRLERAVACRAAAGGWSGTTAVARCGRRAAAGRRRPRPGAPAPRRGPRRGADDERRRGRRRRGLMPARAEPGLAAACGTAGRPRASLAGCPSPSSPIRRPTCPPSWSSGTASTSCRSTSCSPAARGARAWTSRPTTSRGRCHPRGQTVSTSRPTPGDFVAAYRACLDAGADRVVSVHLSRRALRAPADAARLAAAQVGEHLVTVVDSRSAAMGTRLRRARRRPDRRRRARDRREVAEAARRTAAATRTFFVVDTLEHLRRGGRIGAAAALLGSALAVKPVLHMHDGRVVPLEKVRTTARALTRLVQRAVEAAGDGPGVRRGAPPRRRRARRAAGGRAARAAARRCASCT